MLRYRRASRTDAEKIALLHAANWQLNYRGILDDHYLDHQVIEDRKEVWTGRLTKYGEEMCLIVAENDSALIGFGCAFLEEHEQYGAYLDNLHVAANFSGRGIGKSLLSLLAAEILQKSNRKDMYLWVLKDNNGAIRLYEKLRGEKKEQVLERELGNRPVEKIRYYWPDVGALIIKQGQDIIE